MRLTKHARLVLERRRSVTLRLRVEATDASGNRSRAVRTVRLQAKRTM